MKAAEIRELSGKEIVEKLQAEVDNYSRMKLNHAITPLDNPNKIKEVRKTVARINTIIKERERN